MRQNAAFGLMWSEAGIAMLRNLLKHPQVLVRRCVIFAFDAITELTEIPAGVKPAIPILKELLTDDDEVVRRMAKEVLEQIEHRPRK
jgi:HEAT repeat protein